MDELKKLSGYQVMKDISDVILAQMKWDYEYSIMMADFEYKWGKMEAAYNRKYLTEDPTIKLAYVSPKSVKEFRHAFLSVTGVNRCIVEENFGKTFVFIGTSKDITNPVLVQTLHMDCRRVLEIIKPYNVKIELRFISNRFHVEFADLMATNIDRFMKAISNLFNPLKAALEAKS